MRTVITISTGEEKILLSFLPYLMPAITSSINSQNWHVEESQVFSRNEVLRVAFEPNEFFEVIRLLLLDLNLAKCHRNMSVINTLCLHF